MSTTSKANGGAIAGAIVGAATGLGTVAATAVNFPPTLTVPWYGYILAAVAPAIVGAIISYATVYFKAANTAY